MNAETIWPKITDIFRDMFEDSKLTIGPKTMAKDIEGWDSLAHIQLLVAIEKAFEIRFNTGEVAGIANVGEMVELIVSRTADI
jgi:acyl carrier protein